MQSIALALAIGSTVAYHLITKLVPAGAHPIATLMTAYLFGSLMCAAVLFFMPAGAGFRSHFALVNWTAPALAATILLIDLAFILLYRGGFPVAFGALVTQVAAALALLGVGYLVFKDQVTLSKLIGVALCLAGLWLVNRD